jgi:bifunctional non-homologous end joining protein LigD
MLKDYNKKRDFAKTPEPAGSTVSAADRHKETKPLTFVIQKHAARQLHYDFRLEIDGVLVSWAVPKGPSLDPGVKRFAVITEDHPLEYASFEGMIPQKQYGAGSVIIWDHGNYTPDEDGILSWNDRTEAQKRMREGLQKGKLSFTLEGKKLQGSWTLVRLKNKERDWLLIKHKDAFVRTNYDILEADASVVSGHTLADIEQQQTNSSVVHAPDRINQSSDIKTDQAAKNPGRADKTPGRVDKTPDQIDKNPGRVDKFPRGIAPMLATLADSPFTRPGWFFEAKLDGIRAITYIEKGKVELSSRRGLDLTGKYPALVKALRDYKDDLILDGEIIALDEQGRPSFQHLQQRSGLNRGSDIDKAETSLPVIYYVFDILYCRGKDLRDLPLSERKQILKQTLTPNQVLRLVESLGVDGEAAYNACISHGLEGIVGKRIDSHYETGRRAKTWVKLKANTSGEFLICGYTEGTGARNKTFGSLILAEHDKQGRLVYVGGVGTGFDEGKLRYLLALMKPLLTKSCPFSKRPPGKLNPTWVKPELVVEVKYMERSRDNMLRAPVYMHVREDISPQEVKPTPIIHIDSKSTEAATAKAKTMNMDSQNQDRSGEAGDTASDTIIADVLQQLDNDKEKLTLELEGNALAFSNLNKEMWPATKDANAITKRDYVKYLAKVSPYLLPHLRDRLITFIRFPNGINGGKFYQKHWQAGRPNFVSVVSSFTDHSNQDQDFLICNNLSTLLWLGQIADLELHTSHTRTDPFPDGDHLPLTFTGSIENLEHSLLNYPDYLIFDLDPYLYSGKEKTGDEPELHRQGFQRGCDVALWIKEVLDRMSITSYVKTSGRTGLHIYVPIIRQIDYDTVRAITEIIGRFVLKEHADLVTMDWAVVKRTGKVFLDHNMNARSKSLASIYSPRVAPEASVSTPLRWDELHNVYPTDFTIRTVPDRLKQLGDLWADILQHKNDLQTLLKSGQKSLAGTGISTEHAAGVAAKRQRRPSKKP